MKIDKEKARKEFELKYSGGFFDGVYFKKHSSLKLSKTDRERLKYAEEVRNRKERRLEVTCLIQNMRKIEDKTLQEIGDRVGLTRERVRQILLNLFPPK